MMAALMRTCLPALILGIMVSLSFAADEVTFQKHDGWMEIQVGKRPFAEYVWRDEQIRRSYFRRIHAPNGVQVTRNSPPVEGKDAVDHATMHPGLWLSFGVLSNADFWRNKAETKLVEFVEEPSFTDGAGRFAVRLAYLAGEQRVCDEVCRIVIRSTPSGTLLDWTSTFRSEQALTFGDQEEMGLGVRLATPLTVKSGGRILNSSGQQNEAAAWGKTADWCDYSGNVDGQPAGVLLMPDPQNFRASWFHLRDYGLMVANPFGRNAFTRGEKSVVIVPPGEEFRLRFGLLVHSNDHFDPAAAYAQWLK